MSMKKWEFAALAVFCFMLFSYNSSSTRSKHDLSSVPSCWFLLYSSPRRLQSLLWWLPTSFRSSVRVSGLTKDALPITPTNIASVLLRFSLSEKRLRSPTFRFLFYSGYVIVVKVLHFSALTSLDSKLGITTELLFRVVIRTGLYNVHKIKTGTAAFAY